MKNYQYILFIFILSIFLLLGCTENKPKDENLSYVYSITNCDSLVNDSIFKVNYNTNNLFNSKPNSIIESICLLDENLNEYAKQYILICDESELYFSLGLKIRNKWVRYGTDNFQRELYKDIQLQHIDYTSSFILKIYKYYLINDKSKNLIDYLITAGHVHKKFLCVRFLRNEHFASSEA